MTDRGIFRAKGQVWGSWILWNCPTESLVFTAFRAKGQFIQIYFRDFIKKYAVWGIYTYKGKRRKKSALLPFLGFGNGFQ